MKTPLLQLKNISKSYGNLVANKNISLNIYAHSIHALLGENGAGKSTLVNTMYGLVAPDEGEILWQGERVDIRSPNVARELGIGIVFQHFALFPSLSILENIALGTAYKGALSSLEKEVIAVSEQYKLHMHDIHQSIGELSAGGKQRVEIIRCLLQKPKLLILDEPTSVLTPVETQILFETLDILKNEGCAILFIGHKLNEIKAICETATVIRKGQWVGDCVLAEVSTDKIAEMMVGSVVSTIKERTVTKNPKVVFQLNHNGTLDFSSNATSYSQKLQLKNGVITGLAGIAGNGQDQLMTYLSGELAGAKESIEYWSEESLESEYIGECTIVERKKRGILFVPTERLGRSAVTQMNLIENALLGCADISQLCQYGLLNYTKISDFSEQIISQYDVQPPNKEAYANSLSGGNLQKYIVGRAILQNPKILLISNPTWGVDISAATFIRNKLLQLRDAGMAIFIASEDLDEMFAICDEMTVIKNNQLSEVQAIEQLSIEQVGSMMMA